MENEEDIAGDFGDFTSPCGHYTLTFDDDGKVAYAYLKNEKSIVGHIWLYNRGPAPDRSEWKDRNNLPFANCKEFIKDEGSNKPPVTIEDILVNWVYEGEHPRAYIYIYGELIASVSVGEEPGYSRYALKDGPLAKRMMDDID